MGVIREAFLEGLKPTPRAYNAGYKPKLWVSDLGACPRRAMLRVLGKVGDPLPRRVLEVMELGKAYEQVMADMLRRAWKGRIRPQLPLRTPQWSGKADFLLESGGGGAPVFLEHKATGDKWWNYGNNLPKTKDCVQVVMYGKLWREIERTKVSPWLILYYGAWGHWCELSVVDDGASIGVSGHLDGVPVEKSLNANVSALRAELEGWFDAQELPPRPLQPTEALGCLFRGELGCGMWRHCWDG